MANEAEKVEAGATHYAAYLHSRQRRRRRTSSFCEDEEEEETKQ